MKKKNKKISPLLGIAVVGAGAYLLLNSQKAQAQEMPPAGIGSGYGGGAILGTSGSPTTSAPVSSTGDTYNTTYNIKADGDVIQEAPIYSKKDDLVTQQDEQNEGINNNFTPTSKSISLGNYKGTATTVTPEGNTLLDFGENAQAVTLTKKQVAEQSAKSGGAPVVALAPVGNTVSDVVKAGNVATIFAREVANDPRLATPPPTPPKKTTSEPVNTGWGNPVGMVSSWIGSIFGGR